MAIITLTTDFGLKDHYVASIKGAILKQLPDVNIVDVSHIVKQFNVQETAFVLKNAYANFPKGTVHIIGVKAELKQKSPHIIALADGHYFIGADNGIFSLMFPYGVEKIVVLPEDKSVFPTRDVFVKAACSIIRQGSIDELGTATTELFKLFSFAATSVNDLIKGSVEYIDVYGNAITNITEELFKQVGKGRNYTVEMRTVELKEISKSYSDVKDGKALALFNSSGLLEIAMNDGNAAGLMSLKINDPINIHFY